MKILLSLFASLLASVSFAQTMQPPPQIPKDASIVVFAYLTNHCQFSGDMKLEDTFLKSVKISPVAGQIDTINKVELNFELTYGNADARNTYEQSLSLENTTGHYRITNATGPCETVTQQD